MTRAAKKGKVSRNTSDEKTQDFMKKITKSYEIGKRRLNKWRATPWPWIRRLSFV